MNKPTFKHICLMHIQQLTNFPYIEKDFDALTDYELLCKVVDYLNQVITNENVQNENIVALYNAFNTLKDYVDNYFDNLDVQDEINTKLDEMAADGTLEELIGNKINNIEETLVPNNNLHIPMGTTSLFWTSQTAGVEELEKFKKYFDNVAQMIRMTFNTSTQEWDYADSNFDDQIIAFTNYVNSGGSIAGLKFYQTQVNWSSIISTYGAHLVFSKYLDKIHEFLNTISYSSSISTIWLFNEAGPNAFNSSNASEIISVIDTLKNEGYLVSTPYANAYAITDQDQSILNANSFITLNLYPFNDVYGQKSSIKDVVDRINIEYNIIERYLGSKDLVIGEFGCSASWTSFNYPPTYQNDGNGKPISLMLEALYQSKFINNVKAIQIWYYGDAMNYASETLLSIKNNREVRYNG